MAACAAPLQLNVSQSAPKRVGQVAEYNRRQGASAARAGARATRFPFPAFPARSDEVRYPRLPDALFSTPVALSVEIARHEFLRKRGLLLKLTSRYSALTVKKDS
jgi:hypothetical protein